MLCQPSLLKNKAISLHTPPPPIRKKTPKITKKSNDKISSNPVHSYIYVYSLNLHWCCDKPIFHCITFSIAVKCFASLPRTTRGKALVLNGDPKGKNMLYTNGNSVIIREVEVWYIRRLLYRYFIKLWLSSTF